MHSILLPFETSFLTIFIHWEFLGAFQSISSISILLRGTGEWLRFVMANGEWIVTANTSLPPACIVDIVSEWVKQITGLYILSTLYSDKVHTGCQAISFSSSFNSSSFLLLIFFISFSRFFQEERRTSASYSAVFVIVLHWYYAYFPLPKTLCFPNRT